MELNLQTLQIIGVVPADDVPVEFSKSSTGDSEEEELKCLHSLLNKLNETNQELFERIVRLKGVNMCETLLSQTLEAKKGGFSVGNLEEGQIRSDGGNFLALLKEKIPQEEKKLIWKAQAIIQRDKKNYQLKIGEDGQRRYISKHKTQQQLGNQQKHRKRTSQKSKSVKNVPRLLK